jgi:hypothetical protein
MHVKTNSLITDHEGPDFFSNYFPVVEIEISNVSQMKDQENSGRRLPNQGN